ncbi:MAG TPA: hypothetical protein DDY78_09475 [Planctomycetales bacterium]|jgi:hypothetical protein|nr:hypothetical protein [Planctomycetales bacterium]
MPGESEEAFVEQKVTYSLEVEGRFIVIEQVPARVSLRTGERFFAPETVERLQEIVWGQRVPDRVIQTPVYEFPNAVA